MPHCGSESVSPCCNHIKSLLLLCSSVNLKEIAIFGFIPPEAGRPNLATFRLLAHMTRGKDLPLQVKQLSCDGSTAQVCALGGGAHSVLVAALADRLLVLRKSTSGATMISPRHLTVLEPLLRGWSSLAAMGILPGTSF